MVKYRQATQKPSNVCFTGRGRMERAKNSHWVSVFAHNSHRGWITPPLFKQSDNLLNSSDGHKVLLRKPLLNGMTMRQKGTWDCCISPICPPFTSFWKWAVRRETARAGKSFASVYSLPAADRGILSGVCFEISENQTFSYVLFFVFPAVRFINHRHQTTEGKTEKLQQQVTPPSFWNP